MKKRVLLALLVLLVGHTTFAQTKGSIKAANERFEVRNFEGALEEYLQLVQESVNNPLFNYRIGVCYLNTNISKKKAIPYLELVCKTDLQNYPDASYLLGKAYHFAGKYDDAIKMFHQFKDAGNGNAANLKQVDRDIEYCYNAKELVKFPVNVLFENLGKNVNSPYADYYPFISKDEGLLLFNSRRDGEQGVDGRYYSDVYSTSVKQGKWSKAKPVSVNVNTAEGDEEVVGLSPDGNQIVYYFDNNKSSGDLYIGTKNGEIFDTPKLIAGENVNSKHYEIAASLSTDDNDIYFASDRPGGYGGMDIYVSKRLPTGEWSAAQNLGSTINTPYDEDFPQVSTDGKTLYFSSKGHTTMGGYDIFKSQFDEMNKLWGPVRNIGYPINTAGDDMNLCMEEGGRNGYIAAVRDGGQGDFDIYRVVFNEIDPKYTIIRGGCSSSDFVKKIGQVSITVTDKKTMEIYGTYLSNINTNKYVMILPPGNYEVEIEASGFKSLTQVVEVLDKSSFQADIEKDIQLSPK